MASRIAATDCHPILLVLARKSDNSVRRSLDPFRLPRYQHREETASSKEPELNERLDRGPAILETRVRIDSAWAEWSHHA